MIRTRSLTRVFGERTAVDSVSFTLDPGQICVLLGPNGAGKTTTVRMLSGLIRPTSGTATVAGMEIPGSKESMQQLRGRVGLLTETPGLYDRLSAIENLSLFGRLYGLSPAKLDSEIEHHLTNLGLWDRRHDPVAKWSKGMRQKLAIARTVFHDPEVLFFDEPTAGLDPESARVVRQMILARRKEGCTIVVSTHNLLEAAELADVVGVIRGRLLAFGPPHALNGSDRAPRCRITVVGDPAAAAPLLRPLAGVVSVAVSGQVIEVEVLKPEIMAPAIATLVGGGVGVIDARAVERSLEDFYLEAVSGRA